MNKIVLALATVATLGLSTAAFAENPTSSIKERAQPVQSHNGPGREGPHTAATRPVAARGAAFVW
jgi:hypothetical protein